MTKSSKMSDSDSDETCVRQHDRSFASIVSRFSDRTSCVGPGYISSSESPHRRVLWVAFFIGAMALTIYMTHNNFKEFYSQNKKTSIQIGFSPLKFPTVTICNCNPVRRSSIDNAESAEFRDFLHSLDTNGIDFGQLDDIMMMPDAFWNETEAEIVEWFPLPVNWKRDPRAQVQEEFLYMYGSETSSVKYSMGHSLQDMLVHCSFAGGTCDENDFQRSLSVQYGTCYSFNPGSDANLTSFKSGNGNGLQLILFLENHEYIDGLTSGYGARVVVTPNGALPLPDTNGVFVSAGEETDIGLQLVNISRLSTDRSPCMETRNSKNYHGFTWQHIYTRQACQATCFIRQALERCGCILLSQFHLYPDEIYFNESMTFCTDVKEKRECVTELNNWRFLYNNITCSCPNPCWEPVYDSRLSSRKWPTNGYVDALHQVICDDYFLGEGCLNLEVVSAPEKRQNFLKLNVFFRDLNFEDVREEPDYPESQFFSDLGGSIGLFLGLSVLSLFEIIDLLLELVEWGLGKCLSWKKNSRKNSDDDGIQPENHFGKPFSDHPKDDIAPIRWVNSSQERV